MKKAKVVLASTILGLALASTNLYAIAAPAPTTPPATSDPVATQPNNPGGRGHCGHNGFGYGFGWFWMRSWLCFWF